MELFTIKLNENTKIFRAAQDNNIGTNPLWFAETETIASKYGINVYMYKTSRALKLLDISNSIFHLDYMSKLNNSCNDNICMNPLKGKLLAPLGLPDYETQLKYIKPTSVGFYEEPKTDRDKKVKSLIDNHIGFFSGRHRYSVEQSDGTKLVDALMKLYPDHDGYICKSMWPSYHQGGFLLPELCLFKPAICVTTLEKKGGGKRKSKKTLLPAEIRKEYPGINYLEDIMVLHQGH
jgi:hypothetical protein